MHYMFRPSSTASILHVSTYLVCTTAIPGVPLLPINNERPQVTCSSSHSLPFFLSLFVPQSSFCTLGKAISVKCTALKDSLCLHKCFLDSPTPTHQTRCSNSSVSPLYTPSTPHSSELYRLNIRNPKIQILKYPKIFLSTIKRNISHHETWF